jgi:hypothetical protein
MLLGELSHLLGNCSRNPNRDLGFLLVVVHATIIPL